MKVERSLAQDLVKKVSVTCHGRKQYVQKKLVLKGRRVRKKSMSRQPVYYYRSSYIDPYLVFLLHCTVLIQWLDIFGSGIGQWACTVSDLILPLLYYSSCWGFVLSEYPPYRANVGSTTRVRTLQQSRVRRTNLKRSWTLFKGAYNLRPHWPIPWKMGDFQEQALSFIRGPL